MGRMAPMSSPWLASKTPVGPPTAANPTVRQLLYAAAVTGGWSGLVSLVIYLIGRLFGMTFTVSVPGRDRTRAGPVVRRPAPAARGRRRLRAARLPGARMAPRPTDRLLGRAPWAPSLSLIPVLNQPSSVGWFARLVLASMHVITWFLVVPQIARIVGDSEPGQHVDRDE